MKHLTIKIFGRVQGVGFRYNAKREARKFNVTGFARNEPDGSVYIEAEGDNEQLKIFLAWCHKGPYLARVERVEEQWADAMQGFEGFKAERG